MKALPFLAILAILALLPSYSIAQKTRIGFRGGANMTWVKYGDKFETPDIRVETVENVYDTITRKSTPKPSFSLGVNIDYDFSDRAFFATGISILGMNHKTIINKAHRSGGGNPVRFDTSHSFQIVALQAPALLHYRLGHFSLGGGLYGTFCMAGNGDFHYWKNDSLTTTLQRRLSFSTNQSTVSDFNRFDVGLRTEAGYGLKRWRLVANLDIGLINSSPKKAAKDNKPQSYPSRRYVVNVSFLYQPWPR